MRSKRFRLVSEQRNTEEGDFRFWPREKWNESQRRFGSRFISRANSRAKAEPRSKQKTMGERARGEGSAKNRLQSTPWDFWNCVRFLDAGSGIPDWPTECQPVSGCQIPSGYKLQRSTVGWNEAYLIYVRSKNIFTVSVWRVKKKFCSSKTPKNNS